MSAPEGYPPHRTPRPEYELGDVEHELVSKYQPKFLAKGGEHIVYELPEHPDIVAKVRASSLKTMLDWNIEHGQPLDSLPEEIEPRTRKYLKEETERYKRLRKYFGSDHVPVQKEFLVKVPVTEQILNTLYEGDAPVTATEVWGIVMVQRRIEALHDPNRMAIMGGYAESQEVSENRYRQATDHLVFLHNVDQRMEKEHFLEVQSNDDLKNLLDKAESDENLKDVLKELIGGIIAYSEETGEILDIIGRDNIVLFQKEGRWSYSLVDTRYPGEGKMVEKARAALLKLFQGKDLDGDEKNILLNTFNFVRTINGLAEQIGLEKRVRIVPEGVAQRDIDFLAMLSGEFDSNV